MLAVMPKPMRLIRDSELRTAQPRILSEFVAHCPGLFRLDQGGFNHQLKTMPVR